MKAAVGCSECGRKMMIIGRFLHLLVHGLILLETAVFYTVYLPYTERYWTLYPIPLVALLGLLLLVNIIYHYNKARLLQPLPVHNELTPSTIILGDGQHQYCDTCAHYKSPDTHHCSVCKRCIFRMDHHCIWLNQCVGQHNHRHFFLFLAYVCLAMLVILAVGFYAFKDNFYITVFANEYCNRTLHFAFLQEYICSDSLFLYKATVLAYTLALALLVLVGCLFFTNVYLISKGVTFIDILQNRDSYPGFYHKSVLHNWREFLQLDRKRGFARTILLPYPNAPFSESSREYECAMLTA